MTAFITLEGPEGGGKTTQARWLAEHLRARGLPVLFTREPGGTAIGDQIRRILMDLGNTGMHLRTEILLFQASRAQLVDEVLRPHLQDGGLVVCDRYYDASLAYQGYGHQLDLDALRLVTGFATAGLRPDLTLLLDLPVEAGLRRKQHEGEWNRLDAYAVEFHTRVREGYLALAGAEPQRWVIIDATPPIEAVQEEIRRVVEQRLAER